jgi:hypothetical protein
VCVTGRSRQGGGARKENLLELSARAEARSLAGRRVHVDRRGLRSEHATKSPAWEKGYFNLFYISRLRLSARGAARHRHRAHRSPRRPRRRRARHRRPCRRQPRTCGQQLHRDAARYRTMAQLERKIHVRRAPGAEMAHADTSLGQKVNRDPESWGPRRSPSSCTAFLVTSVHLASPP